MGGFGYHFIVLVWTWYDMMWYDLVQQISSLDCHCGGGGGGGGDVDDDNCGKDHSFIVIADLRTSSQNFCMGNIENGSSFQFVCLFVF